MRSATSVTFTHIEVAHQRTFFRRSWVLLVCALMLVGLTQPVLAQDGTPEPVDGSLSSQAESPTIMPEITPEPTADSSLEGTSPDFEVTEDPSVQVVTGTQVPDESAVDGTVPNEQSGQDPPDESITPTQMPASTPTLTPFPTPEPAIPFAPQMTCLPAPGGTPLTTGAAGWTWLECTMTWQTEHVTALRLKPLPPVPGWEIAPVNNRELDDPSIMALNPTDLWLTDHDPADAGFYSTAFSIATRLSCDAQPIVDVRLEFEATSGEQGTIEPWTGQLPIAAASAAMPIVTLTSAVFEPVDPLSGVMVSNGTITMTYSNATAGCGWNATIAVGDFVSGGAVLPASALMLLDVTGVPGLTWSQDGGIITLGADSGIELPAEGIITVTVSMPIPEDIPEGDYSTTIHSTVSPP
jgi:hypothetical protein